MNKQQRALSRRFLAYRFFMNLWFVEAIWVYFYRIFMTDAQVGVLDATAFAVGLIAEVPSGALADRFGRDRVVKVGIVIAAIGMSIQAFGGFGTILFSQSLLMIGFAFMSGADEALFFEKLKLREDSKEWRKFIARHVQAAYTASIIAIPLGSFLYQVNHELAFVINGLAMLTSLLFLVGIHDDARQKRASQRITQAFKEYIDDIATGFKAFRTRALSPYVPMILTLQAVLYIFSWGLLRLILMDNFHFSEEFGGVLMGVACIFAVAVLFLMNKFAERLHERRMFVYLAVSVVVALLASLTGNALLGVIVILVLYAADGIFYPFMSEVINRHAPSERRATVISVASFLKTVPYIVLAPLIGWLNTIGHLDIFLVAWSILIALALVYYLSKHKKDTVLTVDFE